MHLILTGATGLIGSAVLQHMLTTPSISRISILSRRPVSQAQGHAKAEVILHSDFNTYPAETLAKLEGAQGVVWALGISQTAVSAEEYEKITYDYGLAAATAFSKSLAQPEKQKPFNFVYVSGEGATLTPGRLTPRFAVVKGRAESALLKLAQDKANPQLSVYSVRPGGPDPADHSEIWPFIPHRTGLAMRAVEGLLMPVMRKLGSTMLIPTRDLAKVLVDLAAGDGRPLSPGVGVAKDGEGEGWILQNVGVRRLAAVGK